jgi:hypothetical protein
MACEIPLCGCAGLRPHGISPVITLLTAYGFPLSTPMLLCWQSGSRGKVPGL